MGRESRYVWIIGRFNATLLSLLQLQWNGSRKVLIAMAKLNSHANYDTRVLICYQPTHNLREY